MLVDTVGWFFRPDMLEVLYPTPWLPRNVNLFLWLLLVLGFLFDTGGLLLLTALNPYAGALRGNLDAVAFGAMVVVVLALMQVTLCTIAYSVKRAYGGTSRLELDYQFGRSFAFLGSILGIFLCSCALVVL